MSPFTQDDAALATYLVSMEPPTHNTDLDRELGVAGLPALSTLRRDASSENDELGRLVRELIETATQLAEQHALLEGPRQLQLITQLQRNLDIQARKYRAVRGETP